MRYTAVSLRDALDQAKLKEKGYRYVWYQSVSSTGICPVNQLPPEAQDSLEEAVFFGTGEKLPKNIHIFEGENGLAAVESEAEEGDTGMTRRFLLRAGFGTALTVRYYFTHDEDGEAGIGPALMVGYEPASSAREDRV